MAKDDDVIMDVMMKSMFIIVAIFAMAPMLQRMFTGTASASALQAAEYRGIVDNRELRVSGIFHWIDLINGPPYRPWVHAYIINDGPATVEIGINHPDQRFTMTASETRTVDRSGADELIYSIFYVCPRGQNADLRITGEY